MSKTWISYRVEEIKQLLPNNLKIEIFVYFIADILYNKIRYYMNKEDIENESEDVKLLSNIKYKVFNEKKI